MTKKMRKQEKKNSPPHNLTLGWRLEDTGELAYSKQRRDDRAKPTDDDFICVKAESFSHHTAIVGQSGSGKTFFLARLIEELLICTQARCIILDPNADFRRFGEAEPKPSFEKKQKESPGKIPVDEKFEACWAHVTPKVYFGTARAGQQLKLPWPILPLDAIATDDDTPTAREELDNCHQFIRAICYLMAFQYRQNHNSMQKNTSKNDLDMLEWSKNLLGTARNNNPKRYERQLREAINSRFANSPKIDALELTTPFLRHAVPVPGTRDEIISEAVKCAGNFSADTQHRYFLRAAKYSRYGFVETKIDQLILKNKTGAQQNEKETKEKERVDVVDLPSFDDEVKLDAVSGVLELIWMNAQLEWSDAMKSEKGIPAPTFIVVEEAHSLMPERSDNFFAKAVRDQFRRIAAEGRKYGQFLIICTQRPDKIDPFVVSECENIAIMKLGSSVVLGASEKAFGLEGLDLALCLDFEKGKGDALLTGPWALPSQLLRLRGGLRRSKEGTIPMQESWATPTAKIRGILQRKNGKLRAHPG